MCNLSEGVWEDGAICSMCDTVRKLLKVMDISEIIQVMDYDASFVNDIAALIEIHPNATNREIVDMVEFE